MMSMFTGRLAVVATAVLALILSTLPTALAPPKPVTSITAVTAIATSEGSNISWKAESLATDLRSFSVTASPGGQACRRVSNYGSDYSCSYINATSTYSDPTTLVRGQAYTFTITSISYTGVVRTHATVDLVFPPLGPIPYQGRPVITGTPKVRNILTAGNVTWIVNHIDLTYTYQ